MLNTENPQIKKAENRECSSVATNKYFLLRTNLTIFAFIKNNCKKYLL